MKCWRVIIIQWEKGRTTRTYTHILTRQIFLLQLNWSIEVKDFLLPFASFFFFDTFCSRCTLIPRQDDSCHLFIQSINRKRSDNFIGLQNKVKRHSSAVLITRTRRAKEKKCFKSFYFFDYTRQHNQEKDLCLRLQNM